MTAHASHSSLSAPPTSQELTALLPFAYFRDKRLVATLGANPKIVLYESSVRPRGGVSIRRSPTTTSNSQLNSFASCRFILESHIVRVKSGRSSFALFNLISKVFISAKINTEFSSSVGSTPMSFTASIWLLALGSDCRADDIFSYVE